MQRSIVSAILSFLAVLCLGIGQAQATGPTDIQGNPISTATRFGLGVGVGPTFFAQTPIDGADTKLGFMAGGSLFYSITDWFLVGLRGEWETHRYELDETDIDIGQDSIITALPFVELRGPYSFYAFFGAGYNFNDLEDLEDDFGNKVEMDDTLAIKAGAGWDAFVSEYFAVNVEMGWKYNKGDADLVHGDTRVPMGSVDLSSIIVSVGLRYFFPPLF